MPLETGVKAEKSFYGNAGTQEANLVNPVTIYLRV